MVNLAFTVFISGAVLFIINWVCPVPLPAELMPDTFRSKDPSSKGIPVTSPVSGFNNKPSGKPAISNL